MSDWFSTLAAGSELSMDAAAELQERGFIVLPGPVPSDLVERLANAHTAAVASATADDVKIGSTSTRVSDFVNRDPSSIPSIYSRRYSRPAASSSAGHSNTSYYRFDGDRVVSRGGTFIPIPRDQWRTLRMEDQFDAVLYLGSPSEMTFSKLSPALCSDAAYMQMRLKRFELVGLPPGAAERLKQSCSSEQK